ncbi:hypothetical protein [Rhodococcus erythropolis]|uniref:hypothetical protein n=1 Tax=Rhodococcus erythropolis TaxID=1833 RepID=UPI001BE98FB8|nr:hypothetical protein [Rhodococcus erythropolis]MBT2266305.1 hypothetical protein [Rhodococcus erythropolis]
MKPILVAPDRASVMAYRKDHPEAGRWAYMTPRNWRTACRGYDATEIRVIAPVTLTPEMVDALLPSLYCAPRRN